LDKQSESVILQAKRMTNSQLTTWGLKACPGPSGDRRTGALPSLWQIQSDPQQEGKTDHNNGGLACILGLTNPHNQSPQLPEHVVDLFFWVFWFCRHTVSAPSTAGTHSPAGQLRFEIHTASMPSGTHTDGGAVIMKPRSAWLEGTPAISIIFMFCYKIVVLSRHSHTQTYKQTNFVFYVQHVDYYFMLFG